MFNYIFFYSFKNIILIAIILHIKNYNVYNKECLKYLVVTAFKFRFDNIILVLFICAFI